MRSPGGARPVVRRYLRSVAWPEPLRSHEEWLFNRLRSSGHALLHEGPERPCARLMSKVQQAQPHRLIDQLRPVLAPSAERRSVHLGDGNAQERRGDIRSVVDVLIERAPVSLRPTPIPHHADRIDIEQQDRRAAGVVIFGLAGGCSPGPTTSFGATLARK